MNREQNIMAENVVAHIMQNDEFSKWLGIESVEISEGYTKIKMTIRPEMMNGIGILHGGITFSLADSCFAFACNNRNVLSVALDNSINFIKPAFIGDILTAETKEIHNGNSTGLYQVSISNQRNQVIALFKGTCFHTNKPVIHSSQV